jgi:hypothetical protein
MGEATEYRTCHGTKISSTLAKEGSERSAFPVLPSSPPPRGHPIRILRYNYSPDKEKQLLGDWLNAYC